jgi:hypothetical protein
LSVPEQSWPPPLPIKVVALCATGFVAVIFGGLIFGIFEGGVEGEEAVLLLCSVPVPVLFVLAAKDNVLYVMGDTIIIRTIAIVMVAVCSIFICYPQKADIYIYICVLIME